MKRFNVFACVLAVLAMMFLAPIADAACFPRLRAVVRAVARPLQTIRAVRPTQSTQTLYYESTTSSGVVYELSNDTVYIGKGSAQWAAQLASEGRLRHDPRYIGYENVSYGSTTPEGAVRQWLRSPGHRANMPFITDIKCNGPFCVGR